MEREALRLLAWEGLSSRDAARVLGCSRRAFRLRLGKPRNGAVLAGMRAANPVSLTEPWKTLADREISGATQRAIARGETARGSSHWATASLSSMSFASGRIAKESSRGSAVAWLGLRLACAAIGAALVLLGEGRLTP